MDKHLATLKGAFHSAKAKAEKAVGNKAGLKQKIAGAFEKAKATANEVTTSISHTAGGALKCVREYELGSAAVASGGPGGMFAIYDGVRRNKASGSHQGSRVSVWLLDKRSLVDYPKDETEALLTLIRKDAAQMLKLRHPGLLSLVAPLEENRHQLALVTEPVFASVADAIARGANLRDGQADDGSSSGVSAGSGSGGSDPVRWAPPPALTKLVLSTLEIKHGTLQLASALRFLHQDVKVVLRALSPETVVITAEGNWKIAGGFGHAVPLAPSSRGDGGMFYYATPVSSLSSTGRTPTKPLPLLPPMAYAAPELVLGADAGGLHQVPATHAADIFSLGALHYRLIAGRSWLELQDYQQTVGEYHAALTRAGTLGPAPKTTSLGSPGSPGPEDVSAARGVVTYMSAAAPSTRPGAAVLGNHAYFSADHALKALQSLDGFLELDILGRAAFLQSLQGKWNLFDARVLRYRVLPPLLTELRTPQLQPLVLPLILELTEGQAPEDFTAFTLPHLGPLLANATGPTLGTILRSTPAFAKLISSPEVFEANVLPAVLRGVEAPEVLVQEEGLRQVVVAAGRVRPDAMRHDIMPRLHAAALNTTAAAVRVNALVALGKIAPGLSPPEWDATLMMLRQLCNADTSAATMMCVLGVADAVGRAGGAGLTASRVLPLVCPLMLAPGLNRQQLGTVMRILRGMLDRVEAVRMPLLKAEAESGSGVGNKNEISRATSQARERGGSGCAGGEGRGVGGWAIGGVAGEVAISSLSSAPRPPPPGSDPFAASTCSSSLPLMTSGLNTAAATGALTPASLAPPQKVVNSLSTFPLGGSSNESLGGTVSVADQLAAALTSPDDLEALFTEPGYTPMPPLGIQDTRDKGVIGLGSGSTNGSMSGVTSDGRTASIVFTGGKAAGDGSDMFRGLAVGGQHREQGRMQTEPTGSSFSLL